MPGSSLSMLVMPGWIFFLWSNTVTLKPRLDRWKAMDEPIIPAPTISADFGVFDLFDAGLSERNKNSKFEDVHPTKR